MMKEESKGDADGSSQRGLQKLAALADSLVLAA